MIRVSEGDPKPRAKGGREGCFVRGKRIGLDRI